MAFEITSDYLKSNMDRFIEVYQELNIEHI